MSDFGLTPRSAAYLRGPGRPDIDRAAKRYFVYFLRDVTGTPVYIGRSCNVAARIRSHHSTLSHRGIREDLRATWVLEVRAVSMIGPFTWDEAVAEERRQIELNQPRGNRQLTARDHRPATAARSRAAARRTA